MATIPEDIATELTAKVARINVLQRLILQDDFLSLRSKEFAKQLDACTPINEEIRAFLVDLLNQELGIGQADPFSRIGIDMTPEKAEALNQLLERLTRPSAPAPTPKIPIPSDGRTAEEPPKRTRPRSPLEIAAGGADKFRDLPIEEKRRLAQEAEKAATIPYKPS